MDLETGAVVAVTVQEADTGDTASMIETLIAAAEQVESVHPEGSGIEEVVGDKGYHSNEVLADLQARPHHHRGAVSTRRPRGGRGSGERPHRRGDSGHRRHQADPVDRVRGNGTVTIELDLGADARRVVDDVQNNTDAITTFPIATEKPIICGPTTRRRVVRIPVSGDMDRFALERVAGSGCATT